MIIEYEGQPYDFDLDDMDVQQALKAEKHIGGPMIEFEKGMLTGSAACYQVIGWLLFHGGNLDVPIASVNFKFGRLVKAFQAAAEAEAKAEAEPAANGSAPGPTAAASTGRKSARGSSPSG